MNVTRVAALLAVLVSACKARKAEDLAEASSILVVSALRGTTEPCGCTSHPLGGLDRLAAKVGMHRAAGAGALLMVGDTYFEHATSADHARAQDEARASVISDVIERLGPAALVLGPADIARGRRQEQVPRTIELGGLTVALFQRAELDSKSCGALRAEIARAQADARVLLLGNETPSARVCESGADIVLVPGGEEARVPTVAAGALWIDAADRGRYLGQVVFHMGPPGPWTFYDEGKSARVTHDAKRERLRREIEALDDGPAKEARRAKLAVLEAASSTSEKPSGRYVTWKLEAIDRDVEPAGWATDALQGFNQSLCDITRAATRERTCERASSVADHFIGTGVCQGCHVEEMEVYRKSAHAHAWATLERASKSCDLTCVGCHSVGWERPGGYCRLDDVERFANVGCESCHGPGRGHAMNPTDRTGWSASFVRDPAVTTCVTCHNPQHSDTFDFATYRPRILGPGHGG